MAKMISTAFPFKSKYVDILGAKIHYIDESLTSNENVVFLFIHGNPTSSYLWRNIIPYTSPFGRTIALDLVGFGKSGKPQIDYGFQEHYNYVKEFITTLKLENIILVLHDWGGAIGFNYAMNHSYNIKGLVFMETFCKPMEWKQFNFVTKWVFKKFRGRESGQVWNGKYNFFLNVILPMSIIRRLSIVERAEYYGPFLEEETRLPIVKFPQELPFVGEGSENEIIANNYYNWLKTSPHPKLLLFAKPGVQITKKEVGLYKVEFPNLTTAFIGKGKHFIQEDQPDNIGEAIENWCLVNF